MHNPIDRIIHTTAFITPVVEHWLEQEIAISRTSQCSMTDVTKDMICTILSVGWYI